MNMLKLTDLIYKWRISETINRLEKKLDNEIYVIDLIHCPLKYYYQKQYKELTIASAINPVTILGELIHYGIEEIILKIFNMANVKIETEFVKEIEVDGAIYIIKGRIDAIVDDYIIEIKSSRSDTFIPQTHHVIQTRIYLWLTGYRKAILLYITPNRIVQFDIDDPATNGEISDLVRGILYRSPIPRYPWECNYCIYSVLCSYKKSYDNE